MVKVFSEGYVKTDEQIVKSRQNARDEENYLVDEIPENCALLNITMRIPGPIKNNRYISRAFNIVVNEFLKKYKVLKEVLWDLSSGPQAFLIIEMDAAYLKQQAVNYEEEEPLGPISEISVFGVVNDNVSEVTRKELDLEPRTCLLCDRQADECQTQQNHTLDELRQRVDQIINQYVNF
ncbi:citrate lyase holo-[acyl-carrier protein] synthase [Companilactobacillus versmoldensis]|uniref:citrate lyase holo-[acyl-carrier protein] synthase n=1 Tax=Companilactobacillus versmoldensis DSM 14857 = KCTC 3814 TaxID=1423815 RepID=A0A0R1SEZ9_9LACO|nr:citrate lyase holo-[acyl-carrier protein] synthase [Companilactobacillus versmoldensis]KRL67831.1 phosphoribosyl-dephospho-CoA transferase (holo-ACP synthetase) [Companilactobacillus versmoldensis DSM 14857 = KCTC 3814]